jgi:hypothetical protein
MPHGDDPPSPLGYGGREEEVNFSSKGLCHYTSGDDRFRQRDYWCAIASVRDGNGSRYPHVAPISAKDIFASLAETVENAYASLTTPAYAMAA